MLLIETEIRQSDIHGMGLFCVAPIARGTKVWEFHPLFDIVLDESQLPTLPAAMHKFIEMYAYRAVATNELILNIDQSRHMNHAAHPTLVCDADSNYYAAFDLPAGTELTCDYGQFSQAGCEGFISNDAEPASSDDNRGIIGA